MLEISDFMMLEKIAVVKTNIYKLRDFGFKIAVDGFEIDGQSVQAVQRAPIDVIKLGRNFLKDIENNFMKERLLEILVKFATENNRTLISEGVETPEIAKYVKDQNVFLEQGYLFGKPMSEEAFNEYLEKHQYRVILEDVTNIEDTENIMRMVGGDKSAAATEEVEEELSAEDLLNQTVSANASSVVEEETTGEEGQAEGGFDDFLEDDSEENK
jgi:EAL domain-containing protein (putative c-di-GMP-specific phosphodiesterase class I)